MGNRQSQEEPMSLVDRPPCVFTRRYLSTNNKYMEVRWTRSQIDESPALTNLRCCLDEQPSRWYRRKDNAAKEKY